MLNIKKFRKLLRSPVLFFHDYLKNTVRKIAEKQNIVVGDMNPIEFYKIRPSNFNIDEFITIFSNVPDFFVAKHWDGSIAFCTTTIRKDLFLSQLLEICIKNCFICSIKQGAKHIKIVDLRQLLSFSAKKKAFLLRFNDRQSLKTFDIKVEIWEENSQFINSPNSNPISRKIAIREVNKHKLLKAGKISFLDDIIKNKELHEVDFDIDVVYTWVNSQDEDWQKIFAKHNPDAAKDNNSLARFRDREELKFSLRSIGLFAPWVRKIFIVSNCKPPEWLLLEHEKIEWVFHENIFEMKDLPTFNSHAIESRLHKIEGLSNHFIYFNDDFSLAKPCRKSDFFFLMVFAKLNLNPMVM